eukprot:15345809-Ditylum_brightwellii.AAC.1
MLEGEKIPGNINDGMSVMTGVSRTSNNKEGPTTKENLEIHINIERDDDNNTVVSEMTGIGSDEEGSRTKGANRESPPLVVNGTKAMLINTSPDNSDDSYEPGALTQKGTNEDYVSVMTDISSATPTQLDLNSQDQEDDLMSTMTGINSPPNNKARNSEGNNCTATKDDQDFRTSGEK